MILMANDFDGRERQRLQDRAAENSVEVLQFHGTGEALARACGTQAEAQCLSFNSDRACGIIRSMPARFRERKREAKNTPTGKIAGGTEGHSSERSTISGAARRGPTAAAALAQEAVHTHSLKWVRKH